MATGQRQSKTVQTDDASGRGSVEEYLVGFPARMQPYTEAEIAAVVTVMRDAEAQTQGAYMRQFEADFKEYIGANHALAVDNCTNALRLAAILCDLGPGDEVIIPAYTFCATAIPFGMTGAKIVWADMHQDTWMADPQDIARKITDRTKAIVVVHLLGIPANMPAIVELAEEHGLRVVEDCAQAPGASIDGKMVGSFGDFGCFSLHGAKNKTTLGEGGVLTVRCDEDAALALGLRHNGCRAYPPGRERYWVPAMSTVDIDIAGVWPNNFCIGEAQCALGSIALKDMDSTNDELIAQGMKLRAAFADVPELSYQKIPDGYRHVFHTFIMHFDGSEFGKDRDDLLDILVNDYKLRCIAQYHPLYRYPLFQKLGAGEHDCPALDAWWDNSFSLPWYRGIPAEKLDYVISSVKSAIATLKGQLS